MKYSNEKKDLAAALRWFARLDMNEGIANHLVWLFLMMDRNF